VATVGALELHAHELFQAPGSGHWPGRGDPREQIIPGRHSGCTMPRGAYVVSTPRG
jgi:hypothetical protein